jgi:nucleoside-diphosphate-sugar epimerase
MTKPLPTEDLDAAIELAEECLLTLRGAKIFLTGCTGFFGVWILETFVRADHRLGLNLNLTALSRDPALFVARYPQFRNIPGLNFLRGEVTTFPFPEGRFTHVIHGATTAARETFAGEKPLQKFDTVAMGTRRVLKLCEEKRIGDMLYISSGAVYGRPAHGGPICESDTTALDSLDVNVALGQAKRAAEFFCACAAEEMFTRIRIARCFSFVGPLLPLDIHYAIGNFIADAVANRPVTVKGDGLAVRSYLYMSDLVWWLTTILVRGHPIVPYNVGSEDARTILEIAQQVAALSGQPVVRKDSPPTETQSPARANYVPATGRAARDLGLRQTVPFDQAVRKTLRYHAGKAE